MAKKFLSEDVIPSLKEKVPVVVQATGSSTATVMSQKAVTDELNSAKQIANNAQSAATSANTAASNAQATADNAKSAANTAQSTANGKQDKLVSGTNIKTINGQTLLGNGDITVGGSEYAVFTDAEFNALFS